MAVSNCPMCGHPDYLPRGCCHWREIRRLEAEIGSLRAENEDMRICLEAYQKMDVQTFAMLKSIEHHTKLEALNERAEAASRESK